MRMEKRGRSYRIAVSQINRWPNTLSPLSTTECQNRKKYGRSLAYILANTWLKLNYMVKVGEIKFIRHQFGKYMVETKYTWQKFNIHVSISQNMAETQLT